MKKILFSIALIASALSLMSCITVSWNGSGKALKGSGNVVVHNLGELKFSAVKASRMIKVTIVDSLQKDVIVRADDNLLEYINLKVEGGELIASFDHSHGVSGDVTLDVIVPNNGRIRSLEASGASKIECESVLRAGEMELDASGASMIEVTVEARELSVEATGASKCVVSAYVDEAEVDVSGASKAVLTGRALRADLEASGASKIKASELLTDYCTADAGGASKIVLHCDKELVVRAGGASKISYYGDCQIKSRQIGGASEVERE